MWITQKSFPDFAHYCVDGFEFIRTAHRDNRDLFGTEANPTGHGHNYVVEVSVSGQPDAVTGMVMDLKDLKEILDREVVGPYDHRFLNYETPPFDHVIPTADNIARDIWTRIEPNVGAANRSEEHTSEL